MKPRMPPWGWCLSHALKDAGWAAASGVQPKRSLAAFERRVGAFIVKTCEESIRKTKHETPACRACGKTLAQCNAQPECSETNSYEHDIPGHHMVTTLTEP
jgi:hypothetical protein